MAGSRARRAGEPERDSAAGPSAAVLPDAPGPVEAVTRAELVAAGREGSHLGAAGLALARRIDAGRGVQGYAQLVREYRATMAAALAGVAAAPDLIDDLLARRDRKLRVLTSPAGRASSVRPACGAVPEPESETPNQKGI